VTNEVGNTADAQPDHPGSCAETAVRPSSESRTPPPRLPGTLQHQDGGTGSRRTFPGRCGERRATLVPPSSLYRRRVHDMVSDDNGDVAPAQRQSVGREEEGDQAARALRIDAKNGTDPVPALGQTAG